VVRRRRWIPLLALGAGLALPQGASATTWTLKYAEDFNAPLNTDLSPWEKYDYTRPVDDIMDDNGDWWKNDYGEDKYLAALHSYQVYRKNVRFGTDGWLTATLSARDWAKDGTPDTPPTISTKELAGQGQVLDINSPDAADGAFVTTSEKLPPRYRLEYHLKTLDFGGERNGSVDYDGKSNGYTLVPGRCKSQFPHAEGIGTPGWNSQITTDPCDYQSVTEGRYGYNAFHLMGIVDFAHPEPSNLHFWHYRRKILMDSFAQHPDRVGTGSGGRVCDPVTNTFYTYRESTKNVVDMWINGLPNFHPGKGGITGNGQYFHTTCTGGTASNQVSPSAAAEFRPEVMPNEDYVFAIERTATSYIQEVTGDFGHGVGHRTIRFERPFIVDNVPVWHYNNSPEQYDGRYNNTLHQTGATGKNQDWPDQWPAGSSYPDFPVIGDPYTDAGEGNAKIDSIKLFVPAPETSTEVGGTVPPTLALSLGAAPSLGSFIPGLTKDYTATTTATVTSSAGDATLSVADPSGTATGHLVNGAFSLPSALEIKARDGAFAEVGGSASPTTLLTYPGPAANDAVPLTFQQHVGEGDALRTGSYAKTLTFTLSTTAP
jgi:hypothetical protein